MNNKLNLNVQAIFDSLDGEVNGFHGAGELCTFIRLKGCSLRCQYCDTVYAQKSEPENWMTVDEIIQQIHFQKVTVTGGEPLLQKDPLFLLLFKLVELDYLITVETNGSVDIPVALPDMLPDTLRFVADYKLPSSNMESKMDPKLFPKLRTIDVVKFVISDEEDYKRACEVIKDNPSWLARKVFSPAIDIIEVTRCSDGIVELSSFQVVDTEWPRKLAEMMISNGVSAQFSLQNHKVIWPGATEER